MYIYFVEKSFFDKNCICFFNEKLKIILKLYNCLDIFMIALKKKFVHSTTKLEVLRVDISESFSKDVLYISIMRIKIIFQC